MKLDLHRRNADDSFNLKEELFSWLETLIFSLVFVSLIVALCGRIVTVEGSSMYPTLEHGESIVINSMDRDFRHNDIVVISRRTDTALVKRVIAIGGDRIRIDFKKGEVYLNGLLLHEPFISELTHNTRGFSGEAVVPPGYVFVMGDNRNHSDDSRHSSIGMIDERNIFGKVVFRMFPLNHFGNVG